MKRDLSQKEKADFIVWLKYRFVRQVQKKGYVDWNVFNSDFESSCLSKGLQIEVLEKRLREKNPTGGNGYVLPDSENPVV